MAYVLSVKNRYKTQPRVFRAFLKHLQRYQDQKLRASTLANEVSQIFSHSPDLIETFHEFIPKSLPVELGRS